MKSGYVLDANAILNLVDAGPGAPRVKGILQDALNGRSLVAVSVLNWGEAFYYVWQRRGEEKARNTMASLSRLPLDLVPVDLSQALMAGQIEAVHKIPYVDCVAAALAEARQATLVTSDRDFEKLGRRVQVLWIAHS